MSTVTVTLYIENHYENYGMVVTTPTATVPMPPDEDSDEYHDWANEHIMALTGTGRTDGDSWYIVDITESSAPELVGRNFEFGL